MAEKDLVKQKEQTPAVYSTQAIEKGPTPESDGVYLPHVDIVETGTSFHLMLDMPGVEQEAVNITVEDGVLTIEGQARVEVPQGYDLIGQEYEVARFRRDFRLPEFVNVDGIKAKVSRGVLEVTVPKREEARKRRVEIET
ncbi:MAG: Hsp20/alpha crystallin family protein [Kiritimatiellia bacterium]